MNRPFQRQNIPGPLRKTGGCFLIVWGLFFIGIPTVGIYFMAQQFGTEAKKRGWTETPCEVRKFEIDVQKPQAGKAGPIFRPVVEYTYRAGGKAFTGTRIGDQDSGGDEYEPLIRLREKVLGAPQTICYVNPANPAEAQLSVPSNWRWFALLIPGIFIAVGLTVVVTGLRRLWGKGRQASLAEVAKTHPRSSGGPLLWLFFGVFSSVGAGMLYPLLIRPLQLQSRARYWVATPCTIEWSRVKPHSGSKGGRTYSVDVFYKYRIAGRDYFSQRHDFGTGSSSSGRQAKADVVATLPAGSQQTCYVDPADPTQAVLQRELGTKLWWGLFPLPFLLVGAAGLFYLVRQRLKIRAARMADGTIGLGPPAAISATGGGTEISVLPPAVHGEIRLDPGRSRVTGFLGIFIGALIWNAFMWMFRTLMADDAKAPFFAVAIVWLFSGIGVLLLGIALWKLLALANPRTVVRLHQGPLRVGQTVRLSWQTAGRISRLRSLRLQLEGTEEATYRNGKNTGTARSVFLRLPLVETADAGLIGSGEITFALPADTMHSLVLPHNKIVWRLTVSGAIAHWPDIADSHPLAIFP